MVSPTLCATTAMLAKLFYPYFELSFGTLYPAYASWKSMKHRDRPQYQPWMMYWVSYGSFQLVQIFTDMFIGFWFPFYYELKIIFLIWLVSLKAHGAKLLYTYVINHELTKHEKTIDIYVDRVSGLSHQFVRRLWREFSKLAPKVISVLLRLMLATSEGLPQLQFDENTGVAHLTDDTEDDQDKMETDDKNELEEKNDKIDTVTDKIDAVDEAAYRVTDTATKNEVPSHEEPLPILTDRVPQERKYRTRSQRRVRSTAKEPSAG